MLAFPTAVAKDETEAAVIRAQAYFTLGLLRWQMGDREGAARHYRRAVAVAVNAPEDELRGSVMLPNAATMQYGLEPVRNHLWDTAQSAEDNLAILEQRAACKLQQTAPVPRVGSQPDPQRLISRVSVNFDGSTLITLKELHDLERVVGSDCSHCGRQRAPGAELKVCSRCRKAFYCDMACQKAAWKTHKKVCRKLGDLVAGDLVVVNGLPDDDELNGLVVVVLGPTGPESPGLWEVATSNSECRRPSATQFLSPSRTCSRSFRRASAAAPSCFVDLICKVWLTMCKYIFRRVVVVATNAILRHHCTRLTAGKTRPSLLFPSRGTT